MRHSSSGSEPRTWMAWKEKGKEAFENCNYGDALTAYNEALHPDFACPSAERQVMLSNIVACRLKIGGPAQARAAVENAKQCIAINNKWSKGHVRLASAYIALGSEYSNEACNALQRALNLDPGNASARQMLLRELRRDQRPPQAAATTTTTTTSSYSSSPTPDTTRFTSSPDASAPPHYYDDTRRDQGGDHDDFQDRVDDSLSWKDRMYFYYTRAVSWYESLSSGHQTILKFAVVLLFLYIAFGGRFGWEGSHHASRGNYGYGNAYDRYRNPSSGYDKNDYYNNRRDQQSQPVYDSRHYDGNYYSPPPRRGWRTSFHVSDLFDGSLESMLILCGLGYLAYRSGFSPFQALLFLDLIGGRRRRRRRRHHHYYHHHHHRAYYGPWARPR